MIMQRRPCDGADAGDHARRGDFAGIGVHAPRRPRGQFEERCARDRADRRCARARAGGRACAAAPARRRRRPARSCFFLRRICSVSARSVARSGSRRLPLACCFVRVSCDRLSSGIKLIPSFAIRPHALAAGCPAHDPAPAANRSSTASSRNHRRVTVLVYGSTSYAMLYAAPT